jgi:MFS family permease
MLTMPLAGMLADRIGPGKIVLTGIAVITVGMGMFTQLQADTSYAYLLGALFIMGLGMGCTMMPIMSAALATLREHTIARGSTLMNIVQQVAASIGTAVFSVLLTNGTIGLDRSKPAAYVTGLADAFADVFVIATVMVAVVLVPAFFLPRKKVAHVDPTMVAGH